MAILSIPSEGKTITNVDEIRSFFEERDIFFDQWHCDVVFDDSATQEEILDAYRKDLKPFMEQGGYQTADVISINKLTENYDGIRAKFLSEHTHSEDEIRFFVDGQGLFWFHLDDQPVFNLLCEKGDLISVPAGTKHWFDAGAKNPFVKAIRIFIDMSGWVPQYTDSKKESEFDSFEVPKRGIKYILTDIEGTTTAVSFVYEILFPYFNNHIDQLKDLKHLPEVQEAFNQVKNIRFAEDGVKLESTEEIIQQFKDWSAADKKITPLKTVQGVLWDDAYRSGLIKGHVYEDVKDAIRNWVTSGIKVGIFSSGSVAAQKLIFGFSEAGDLTPYLSNYFDTATGGKRDAHTYKVIAEKLNIEPSQIVFLSDIVEELEAADQEGYRTIQLVRPGTESKWKETAKDFNEVQKKIG